MASLAISVAIGNVMISTEVINVNEYPDLAQRYEVSGVPKTVINESIEIVGMVPEAEFVDKVAQTGGPS